MGANYNPEGEFVDDEKLRCAIEEVSYHDNSTYYYLTIPTGEQLASIIDGQHRVFGFENSSQKDMPLVCSVFIDLPMPYHAQLFTKINTTQKRVDKNLAYNLFQFDMEQGTAETWGPEILAVYLARVLASDDDSPLKNLIKLGLSGSKTDSSISMASVVDGILSLISSKPENDRNRLHKVTLSERDRTLLKTLDNTNNAPLRALYIRSKDKSLYELISNYFFVLKGEIWDKHEGGVILKRTLGIQASFDFLKEVTKRYGADHKYTIEFFVFLLSNVKKVNFSSNFFGVQSKARTRVKNSLLVSSGLKSVDELMCSEEDKKVIRDLIG